MKKIVFNENCPKFYESLFQWGIKNKPLDDTRFLRREYNLENYLYFINRFKTITGEKCQINIFQENRRFIVKRIDTWYRFVNQQKRFGVTKWDKDLVPYEVFSTAIGRVLPKIAGMNFYLFHHEWPAIEVGEYDHDRFIIRFDFEGEINEYIIGRDQKTKLFVGIFI